MKQAIRIAWADIPLESEFRFWGQGKNQPMRFKLSSRHYCRLDMAEQATLAVCAYPDGIPFSYYEDPVALARRFRDPAFRTAHMTWNPSHP